MNRASSRQSGPETGRNFRWQVPLLAAGISLFAAGMALNWSKGQEQVADKYATILDEVGTLNAAGQHGRAREVLEELTPDLAEMSPAVQQRFHVLVGDTIFLGQQLVDWEAGRNPTRIIEAYQTARGMGYTLEDLRIRRLAESLDEAGRDDEALSLLDELGPEGAEARRQLLRSLIQTAMDRPTLEAERTEALIDRLAAEPGLDSRTESWATARRAEIALRQGRAVAAINLLLMRLARISDVDTSREAGQPDPASAELMVMLGRAYLADGDVREAERWFDSTRARLAPEDDLMAEVLAGLGHIRFDEDNVLEALEYFSQVVERFPTSPVYPQVLVAKAQAEARRGAPAESMADYRAAIALLDRNPALAVSLRPRVIDSLRTEHDLRFGQSDYERAAEYLELEAPLHGTNPPLELLARRALTQEMLALTMLGLGDTANPDLIDWKTIDPVIRKEAGRYLRATAEAYSAHAVAVAASDDRTAFTQSLWKAADYFDRAGMVPRAIETFDRLIQESADEPRRLAATYRLAQTYHSDGQLAQAAERYQNLIEKNPRSPEAYASLIPLARVYLELGPDLAGRAEQVLRSIVEDHPALRPESPEYRAALAELGSFYYERGQEGDYELAIARIDELLRRERDEPLEGSAWGQGSERKLLSLRYQLADSYLRSARQITERLEAPMPPGERDALAAVRAERLNEARRQFGQVIAGLDPLPADQLGSVERLDLRNSHFQRADCAFELGQFEGPDGAIALYEQAVSRFGDDPAVLVALMGMINSYAELARRDPKYWEDAQRVNRRAKVYLQQMPDSVFDDPNLPMDRRHWQRWLDSMDDMTEYLARSTIAP